MNERLKLFYRCDQPDRSVGQEQLPVVGYLNYTDVSSTRWHKCQSHHYGGGDDFAISRLGKKKFDRVTPKEWTEDPYFVCVLLSLTQFQERRLKSPRPKIHLVSAPYPLKFPRFCRFVPSLTYPSPVFL